MHRETGRDSALFQQPQGRPGSHSESTVGVSVSLRRQDGCKYLRLIIRGRPKGGRKVDWREASEGKLRKQGTTGKASMYVVLSDVW